MDVNTDWSALWADLVSIHERANSPEGGADPWEGRARKLAERVRQKWAQPDPIRDFLTARIGPTDTVLDIGAGTGNWAVPLARVARRVTALEPSPAMRAALRETLDREGVTNVDVVDGYWPEMEIEPHDVTLCSHSMYGVTDLATFVGRMVDVSRRSCYLLMRAPTADGVMAEAARRVLGHPHDSPNFFVAFNILAERGVRPNVLFDPNLWEPWTSRTIEAALVELKSRLGIAGSVEYDDHLLDLLGQRLVPTADGYDWPRGVQSVLAYWDATR